MSFTALTSGQCDANSPLDETLVQLVRTNFDDHESRIKSLEDPNVRMYEHFARTKFYTNNDILVAGGASLTYERGYSDQLTLAAATAAGTAARWRNQFGASVSVDNHIIRAQDQGTLQLIGAPGFYFDNRTKPITLKLRMQIDNYANWSGFYFGLFDAPPAAAAVGTANRPTNGIWLEDVSAGATWRFTCRNAGSANAGTAFSRPSSTPTWFTMEITFTNSPSNQAVCKIDGSTVETLTTELPTAKTLFPILHIVSGGSGTLFGLDRIEAYASGALSDAA